MIPFISALRRPRAFWISFCNLVGLVFSLVGLILLFIFALPNVAPGAPSYLAEGGLPGWEKQERRYHRNATFGLCLAVVGTLMEAVPPFCTAIGSARRRRIPPSDNADLDAPAPP